MQAVDINVVQVMKYYESLIHQVEEVFILFCETHQAFYISYKNSPNFLLNMFHLEPTPLSLLTKIIVYVHFHQAEDNFIDFFL